LQPSAFNSITWQRLRKQWLSPFLKPSSNDRHSIADGCDVFSLIMAAKIQNNIIQTTYLIYFGGAEKNMLL
jgi:hypothetical protein